MDTAINVGIGGAANVAVDLVWGKLDFLAGLGATTKNAIKIAGGAVLGSMAKNKYVRAAADGIAVVGVSNLIASYLPGEEVSTEPGSGLPDGMIGRVRLGQSGFRRRVAGLGETPSAMMDK